MPNNDTHPTIDQLAAIDASLVPLDEIAELTAFDFDIDFGDDDALSGEDFDVIACITGGMTIPGRIIA